jgi:hypothetical protein
MLYRDSVKREELMRGSNKVMSLATNIKVRLNGLNGWVYVQ